MTPNIFSNQDYLHVKITLFDSTKELKKGSFSYQCFLFNE